MRVLLTFAMITGLLSGLAAAQSPFTSFDCTKANKPDERTICANNDLAQTDGNLGATYDNLLPLVHGEKRRDLIEGQRKWLEKRAECGSDVSCLETVYARRQKTLDAFTKGSQASAALTLFRKTGQCTACNLSGADLSGMKPAKTADNGLMQCTVDGRADGTFDGARVDHADFISCNTKYSSGLGSMSWNGASLKGTDFTDTNLGGNSFQHADLTGANLSGANLYWVDMSNAKLARANLTGVQSTPDAMNGICSDFTNADFSGAKVEKAELCGSFYNANFAGANLRNTKIYGHAKGVSQKAEGENDIGPVPSDSSSGRFGGKINLTGADLRDATVFSETKLTPDGYAFAILCRTKMPDGTTSNRNCK